MLLEIQEPNMLMLNLFLKMENAHLNLFRFQLWEKIAGPNISAVLKLKKCLNQNSTQLIQMILFQRYGADTFRMYEMFLGPVEQSKPWDTKGIEGVHRFLKKFWRFVL